jgi:hypothetical protein
VVRFLIRQQDRHRFRALIGTMRDGQAFGSALLDSYGIDVLTLEHEWREDVAKRYTFWPILFSGTFVWMAALGLVVWGWRRRRARDRATLARWAREEAAEDAVRRQLLERAEGRIHIVLARGGAPAQTPVPAGPPEGDVPKVEHEGEWHTLH